MIKVEKSFDIKFGEKELEDVHTFGKLCDIIGNKVQGDSADDCTTQQAFYKVRNAIADVLLIDKRLLRPATELALIFPRHTRRKNISSLKKSLGINIRILRSKYSITDTLSLLAIGSILGLFIAWKISVTILAIAVMGLWVAGKFGNELDIKTIRSLTQKISRENYREVRRNRKTINKVELEQKVKELFSHDLDLDDTALTRDATFN